MDGNSLLVKSYQGQFAAIRYFVYSLNNISSLFALTTLKNGLFDYHLISFISERSPRRLQAIKSDTICCHGNFILTQNKTKNSPFPDMNLEKELLAT